ncbi:hypothetical protein V5799_003118 [Amblyomma americanum]|uniref:M13 family peptidase n=1 Tax=Amblyomma americanum TaxID=6943 RepID=A0AAQ4D9W1_AMBAM
MTATRLGTLGDAGSVQRAFADAEQPSSQQLCRGEPSGSLPLKIKPSESELTEETETANSTEQQTQPSEASESAKEENIDLNLDERRQPDPCSRGKRKSNSATGDDSLSRWPSSVDDKNSALVASESEAMRKVLRCFISPEKSQLPRAGEGAESFSGNQNDTELPKFGVTTPHRYEPRCSGATSKLKTRSLSDFTGTSPFLVDLSSDQDVSEFMVEQPEGKKRRDSVKAICRAPISTRPGQDNGTVDAAVEKSVESKFPIGAGTLKTAKSPTEHTFAGESLDSQQRTKDSAPSSVSETSAISLTSAPVPVRAQEKREEHVVNGSSNTQYEEFKYNGVDAEAHLVPEIIIEKKLPKSRFATPVMPEEDMQATKRPQTTNRDEPFSTGNRGVPIFNESNSRRSSRQEEPKTPGTTAIDTQGVRARIIKENTANTTQAEEPRPTPVGRKWGPEPPTSIPKTSRDPPHVDIFRKISFEDSVGNTAMVFADDKKSLFRHLDHTTRDTEVQQKSQIQTGSLKPATEYDVGAAIKRAASANKASQTTGGESVARHTMRIAHKASQTSVSLLDETTESTISGSSSVEVVEEKHCKERASRERLKEESSRRALSKKREDRKKQKKQRKAEGKDKKSRREDKGSRESKSPTKEPGRSAQPKGSKASRSERKGKQKKKEKYSDESLISKPPRKEKDHSAKSPPLKTSKRSKGQKREDKYDKYRSLSPSPVERKLLPTKTSPRKEFKRKSRSKKRKAKKKIGSSQRSSSDLSLKRKPESSKSRKRNRSKRRSRKHDDRTSDDGTVLSLGKGGGELCDFRFGVSYKPAIRSSLGVQKKAKDGGATTEKLTEPGEFAAKEKEIAPKTTVIDGTGEVQDRKATPQLAPRSVAQQPHATAVAHGERPEPRTADEKSLLPTKQLLSRNKLSGQDDSGADSASIAFRDGATSSSLFQWSTASFANIWRAQRQFKWSTLRAAIGTALAETFSSSTTKTPAEAGDEKARLLRDAPESEDGKHRRSKQPRKKRSGGREKKAKHRKKSKSKEKRRRGAKKSKAQSEPSATLAPLIEHKAGPPEQRQEREPDNRHERQKDAAGSPGEVSKPQDAKLGAVLAVSDGPQSLPRIATGSPSAASPQATAASSSPTAETSKSGTKSRSSRQKRDRRSGKNKSKKIDRKTKEKHSKKTGKKIEGGDAAHSPGSVVSEEARKEERGRHKRGDRHKKKRRQTKPTSSSPESVVPEEPAQKERGRKKRGDRHRKKRRHRKPTSSSSPSQDKRRERYKKASSVGSAAKLNKSQSERVASSKSSTKKTKSSKARSSKTSESQSSSPEQKHRERRRHDKQHKSHKDSHRDRSKSPKISVIVDSSTSPSPAVYCCLSLSGVIATLLLIIFALVLFYQNITTYTVLPPETPPNISLSPPAPVETTSSVASTDEHSTHTLATPSEVYYCEAEFCAREGAYLNSLLSGATTAPCVNFYEHVCNGWSKRHPDDPSSIWTLVSRDTLLQEEMIDHVVQLLKMRQHKEVKAVANLYAACAESPSSDHVAEELNMMFARWTIGQWPTPRSRTSSLDDVWVFAAELSRDLDLSTLLEVKTGVNPHKLEEAILELYQPQFLFIQSDQQASQVMALFRSAIQDSVVAVGDIDGDVSNDLVDRLMKVLEVFVSVPWRPIVLSHSAETAYKSIVPVGDLKAGVQRFLREFVRDVGYLEKGSVVVHCPQYLDMELELALNQLSPHDVLDYMGFLVLVRVAPYFGSNLRSLRTLFSLSIVGRTLKDAEGRSLSCAWLLERTLPDCFAKASQLHRQSVGQDLPEREWLSRLESAFGRHARDVMWISNFSSLIIRYRLKRQAVTQLGPRGQTICDDLNREAPSGSLLSYLKAASLQKQDKLRGIFRASNDVLKRVSASDLDTMANYMAAQDVVHVPALLFGESVPGNGSLFAFHLPRLAVRYYRGLVRLLFENIYEHDAPLSMGDEDQHRLIAVRSCFKRDAVQSPQSLRGRESPVPESPLIDALLDQTTALLLAARVFEELLDVRRIWNLDLRFRSLPQLSFRQLFYVYYALDNCEKTDQVYRRHRGYRLPPEYRVNLVLRHDPRFASAFGCRETDAMMLSKNNLCRVFRSE